MFVIAEDELLKRGRRESRFGAAGLESLPAEGDGSINMDKDEGWPTREHVYDGLVVDGRCDEVLLPVLGGIFE